MTCAAAFAAPGAEPRIVVVQHEDDCPLGLFDGWLRAAGAGVTVVRPDRGDPLPEVGGADAPDGLIVLGGSAAATDDERWPWLRDTREMLRAAVDASVPTLGICLGHQLLAVACGGRVEPNPAGKQMGVLELGHLVVDERERLFAPRLGRGGVGAIHWNDDIVVEMPAAGTLLAAAPGGIPQVIRVGRAAWGVQFHPEADERIVADWARSEGPVTPAKQEALARIAAARDDLAAAWRPLAARFAEVAAGRRTATGR
ncbi:MAG TPA: type 1 glutamine amidotransferase [Acidimicrobiales bacterium]